ncbi:MAG: hypothetical protein JJ971_07165 [Balneolaceae bacterium]|nr:hypothetical protein [Balneolaceae bacterium]MBO6546988.1 hypothetical protein [Balneolaceae bacterium]
MTAFISLFLLTGIPSEAQPVLQSLTGSVVVDEQDQARKHYTLSIEDFRYIPEHRLSSENSGYFESSRTKPGIALLSSAIIPGSGQALNGKWGRAAAYFLVDVASILYYVNRNNTAKRNERAYEQYANQNWSVLAYGQWLVEYSRANGIQNGYDAPGGLQEQVFGENPTWGNTPNDWQHVDLATIRAVEIQTPFYYLNTVASNFSHVVQDYGSQQYYELMSKYYQFQPGWQDFHTQRLADGNNHLYRYTWDERMLTANFMEGTARAEEFNNNYRQAGNILKLMLVNHVVSAFDAYFTVKLKNSRIETQANLLQQESFSVTWHF